MNKLIMDVLREIKLDQEYANLCRRFEDFDRRASINWKHIEPLIKQYDSEYRYLSMDKTFVKEFNLEGFRVRSFIGFKGGIFGFGYLVWREGEPQNFFKGNLHTLSRQIDPYFDEKVVYNSPIVTSLDDFDKILSVVFRLVGLFDTLFEEALKR